MGNMNLIEVTSIPKEKNLSLTIGKLSLNTLRQNMLNFHEKRLKFMISRHKSYTNSDVAENILSNWKDSIKKFKMVFPKDYKKALLKMQFEDVQLVKNMKG